MVTTSVSVLKHRRLNDAAWLVGQLRRVRAALSTALTRGLPVTLGLPYHASCQSHGMQIEGR